MAKFKVNENVVRVSDGKIGTIKAREITQMSDSDSTRQSTNVKYLVDFGEGIENWSVVTRNDIQKIQHPKSDPYIVKNYNIDESKSLTIVALVEKTTKFVYDMDDLYAAKKTHGKKLSIGFSIYNGSDVYDNEIGRKIAIHRCKKNPFTTMTSGFSGEFNLTTVESIMDAKADYIITNIDNFYRPQ